MVYDIGIWLERIWVSKGYIIVLVDIDRERVKDVFI